MSQKAVDFVDIWVSNNIFADGYEPEGDNSEARARAEECLLAAQAQGITREELEGVTGDLVTFMAEAILDVNDSEAFRYSA